MLEIDIKKKEKGILELEACRAKDALLMHYWYSWRRSKFGGGALLPTSGVCCFKMTNLPFVWPVEDHFDLLSWYRAISNLPLAGFIGFVASIRFLNCCSWLLGHVRSLITIDQKKKKEESDYYACVGSFSSFWKSYSWFLLPSLYRTVLWVFAVRWWRHESLTIR